MSCNKTGRNFWRDTSGASSLIEASIGVLGHGLVTILAGTMLTASVISFGQIQTKAQIAEQIADTESIMREDIRWASAIDVTSDKSFSTVVAGREGGCVISTWEAVNQPYKDAMGKPAERTSLVNTRVEYEEFDEGIAPAACKGEAKSTKTATMLGRIEPLDNGEPMVTTFNAGGRYFNEDGTLKDGDKTENKSTPQRAWDATWPVGIDLNIKTRSVVDGNSVYTPLRIRQTAQMMDTHNQVDGDTIFLDSAVLSPSTDVIL